MKTFNWIAFLAIAGAAAYVMYTHQPQVRGVVQMIEGKVVPCARPITYSIGTVDPGFGISKSILIADLSDAEDIWEAPTGKDLFKYEPTGGAVTVNLVYDNRQATTDKLKEVGAVSDQVKAQYEGLKSSYDLLSSRVKSEKADYDAQVTAYKADPSDQKYKEVKAQESALNTDINQLNSLAAQINQLIKQYNMNVEQYNQVGASAGQFEEGLYEYSGGIQTISIYEYSGHVQLVRVIAHEMGHALGLDHVSDPAAIMYAVNKGSSLTATDADLAELKSVCAAGI